MHRRPLAILLAILGLFALTLRLTWGRQPWVHGRSQAWLWLALVAITVAAASRQAVRLGPPAVAWSCG